MPAQDREYFVVGHIRCTRAAHHHHIQTRKTDPVLAETLARQAFDAIPAHRRFHAFFRYHQTQARGIAAVFSRPHSQDTTRRLILPIKNQLVFAGTGKPATPAETLIRRRTLPGINSEIQHRVQGDGVAGQADRRVLPLARRRLITRRPPGVLIRARNPWVRLRLITLG